METGKIIERNFWRYINETGVWWDVDQASLGKEANSLYLLWAQFLVSFPSPVKKGSIFLAYGYQVYAREFLTEGNCLEEVLENTPLKIDPSVTL